MGIAEENTEATEQELTRKQAREVIRHDGFPRYSRARLSFLDLESLYLPYHVAHLLVNAGKVVVEDAFLGILGGEGVELGQRHIFRLFLLDVCHIDLLSGEF